MPINLKVKKQTEKILCKMKQKFILAFLTMLICMGGMGVGAQNNERLSFGVISDIHFDNRVGEGAMVKVPKALKNLTSHDKGNTFRVIYDTLKELRYSVHYLVMDGQTYVPQHRERIMIVGFDEDVYGGKETFTFPEQHEATRSVKEILDPNIDPKYTLSDKLWAYLQNYAEKHHSIRCCFLLHRFSITYCNGNFGRGTVIQKSDSDGGPVI